MLKWKGHMLLLFKDQVRVENQGPPWTMVLSGDFFNLNLQSAKEEGNILY